MGAASTPPASPLLSLGQNIGGVVGGTISSLFSPNAPIQGLPTALPSPPTPLLPAGTSGAAFASNPTIQPNVIDLQDNLLQQMYWHILINHN